MSLYDSDVYHCYNDLWMTAQERENAQYQGIDDLTTEAKQVSELVLEIRIHLLQQTRPLPMLTAIDSGFRSAREPHAVLSERTRGPPGV